MGSTMSEKKMQGKHVLVTGSGTGIGREIALEFARQGADVAFHYGRSSGGAESGVLQVCEMGRKAEAFQADLGNLDEVIGLAENAINFLGGIDVLVNNAGITFNKPFLKVTPEEYTKVYNVNMRAQYFLTQKVSQHIIDNNGTGAVCNLTSIHGVSGAPEHSVYAGTKGAIIAYTRSLAIELAHKGIRVNAIAPGCVPVENYQNAIPGYSDQAQADFARDNIPLGRYGLTLEIAKLAVFLCSDDCGFIVGQTIVADGGTTSLMSLIRDFRNESDVTFGKGYL